MKFAKKCPKCGGEVQTKSIKKSIGLGIVDIPVAQFCLNPVCNWYQDFSEAKRPEDIKENVIQIRVPEIGNRTTLKKASFPRLSQKSRVIFGCVIAVAAIILLISTLYHQQPLSEPGAVPVTPEKGTAVPALTTPVPASTESGIQTVVPENEQKEYLVKMDVAHGFNPVVLIINKYDTVVWYDEENQRTRSFLVSKDALFENKRMEYIDRFRYQFNQSGKYGFALAEYPSLKEYPNATGEVIVK
ncbi:Uncharacterised protein [uncultured archaeon]|nr:Uncharacterised protein [uncultured archaeon]